MTKKTLEEYFAPVLDWLDAGAQETKTTPGFNMAFYASELQPDFDGNECGSVCCIAGALNQFNQLGVNGDDSLVSCRDIGHILGLTEMQMDGLFYQGNPYESSIYESTSPADAAITIRKFLKTGEVDWSHLIREGEGA